MNRVFTEEGTAAYNEITVVTSKDQSTLSDPAWSLRWAAPEVVRDGERPSLPSDIWSAGWVCWEVSYSDDIQSDNPSPISLLAVVTRLSLVKYRFMISKLIVPSCCKSFRGRFLQPMKMRGWHKSLDFAT